MEIMLKILFVNVTMEYQYKYVFFFAMYPGLSKTNFFFSRGCPSRSPFGFCCYGDELEGKWRAMGRNDNICLESPSCLTEKRTRGAAGAHLRVDVPSAHLLWWPSLLMLSSLIPHAASKMCSEWWHQSVPVHLSGAPPKQLDPEVDSQILHKFHHTRLQVKALQYLHLKYSSRQQE